MSMFSSIAIESFCKELLKEMERLKDDPARWELLTKLIDEKRKSTEAGYE